MRFFVSEILDSFSALSARHDLMSTFKASTLLSSDLINAAVAFRK
jgi:hypothetical protein